MLLFMTQNCKASPSWVNAVVGRFCASSKEEGYSSPQPDGIARSEVYVLYSFSATSRRTARVVAHLAADTRVGIKLRFAPFGVGEVQHLEVRFDTPPPVAQNEVK